MWARLTSHLYIRLWLTVVATVALLTFLVALSWQITRETEQRPIREALMYDEDGQIIGTGQSQAERKPGDDLIFEITTRDGHAFKLVLPRPQSPPLSLWTRAPFGFGWLLVFVGLAVALGAYPVMRRLTVRLEALQRGVERWGSGDLSTRLQAEGHDEVAFLAERFNRAAERIETLLASHKSLLANASHELRSPLARIRMSIELLNPSALNPDTIALQRTEISRSIHELDQLIDEILLASRLDTQQVDAEPFETLDLTGLAAEECARVGAELAADFNTSESENATNSAAADSQNTSSVELQGSARLLRRLLRNLLENARRYSQGAITLELTPTLRAGRDWVIIKVHDRGPGVPTAYRERIFEPFFRLPGASEQAGGVGLGLALVKSISQRHGGTVHCEDRPGGGASFVVELPAETA